MGEAELWGWSRPGCLWELGPSPPWGAQVSGAHTWQAARLVRGRGLES